MYGYESDEVQISGLPYSFGLNPKAAKMTKFEWIPNGGAEGAEQEALDIKFQIGDKEISYRQFPITKAFVKGSSDSTEDPTHPDFVATVKDFNARMTHIIHAFVPGQKIEDKLKASSITNFKEFCQALQSLLPANYTEIPVDIFFQYQWNLKGENTITFLELPTKMNQGKWITRAAEGKWTEQRNDNPGVGEPALWYVNEKNEVHPIKRTKWFMDSNFAKQQKVGGDAPAQGTSSTASNMQPTAGNEASDNSASGW